MTGVGAANKTSTSTPETSSSAAAGASLSATRISFGNQPIATASSPAAVTLSNSSEASLKITSLSISGANAANFTETNTCGSSIAAGASCKIAVLFTPSGSGTRNATLTINDNATSGGQSVSLSGTGIHDVILKWTPSSSVAIAGYLILRSSTTLAAAQSLFADAINATSYVDSTVQAGQKYEYWIITVSSTGITAASSGVSVTIPSP
jgi:hypothetical protein